MTFFGSILLTGLRQRQRLRHRERTDRDTEREQTETQRENRQRKRYGQGQGNNGIYEIQKQMPRKTKIHIWAEIEMDT